MGLVIRPAELAGAAFITTLVTLALAGCIAMLALILVAGRLGDMARVVQSYLPTGAQ